jgi:branched-chain amino acid transport system permease protein
MIERIIVHTLVSGGVYAVLAIGFSLIFGVARILNLAHTAFYTLAAFGLFYVLSPVIGLELAVAPSVIIVIIIVGLLGMLAYKLFINPVREHHAAVLLITIALAMIIEEILVWRFGGQNRTLRFLIPGTADIFGVTVVNQNLLTLGVVAVTIVAVWLILSKTKLGIAIRAVANDTEIAGLMGISVSRVLMITMGIASALAAIAGVVMAPLTTIVPTMWAPPLTTIMVVVIIGGLGSIKGSVIGAFVLGFVSALSVIDPLALLRGGGAYLNMTFTLAVMVIVLIVRPSGLFGTLFEEEKL